MANVGNLGWKYADYVYFILISFSFDACSSYNNACSFVHLTIAGFLDSKFSPQTSYLSLHVVLMHCDRAGGYALKRFYDSFSNWWFTSLLSCMVSFNFCSFIIILFVLSSFYLIIISLIVLQPMEALLNESFTVVDGISILSIFQQPNKWHHVSDS